MKGAYLSLDSSSDIIDIPVLCGQFICIPFGWTTLRAKGNRLQQPLVISVEDGGFYTLCINFYWLALFLKSETLLQVFWHEKICECLIQLLFRGINLNPSSLFRPQMISKIHSYNTLQ